MRHYKPALVALLLLICSCPALSVADMVTVRIG